MLGRKYCYSKGYGTVNVLYHFSRYSSCYGTCRNVLVYHRTCRYDSVVSNGHARQDGGIAPIHTPLPIWMVE